jgi:fido (protein-threonine AMPylation protein)
VEREHVELVSAFADFCDAPESPFYRSEALSPAETWERSVIEMARLLFELPEIAQAPDFFFSPALLCAWHQRIFGALFPDQGGRLRWRQDGDWEHVFFGGNVGTARNRRVREYRGTHPRRLPKRVRAICDEFNKQRPTLIETQGKDSIDGKTYAAARIYVRLLRAHPWIDGNLRVSFIALQAALLSLNLPSFEFRDLGQHDDLIGWAFRGRNEPYRPLARHIAQHLNTNMRHSDV